MNGRISWMTAIAMAMVMRASGQVVHDGTVGVGGAVSGPNFSIPASRGTVSGRNLFHSFSRFNVRRGQSATFLPPASGQIDNVLARVTGGERSRINGVLRNSVPGSNLFLINPAGVIFGPEAQLDLAGSFHVSTGDFIGFADFNRFDAREPAKSVLTSAAPSAFGFLTKNPGKVSLVGNETLLSLLEIGDGNSISVAAGDIRISRGALIAPNGNANLVATGAPRDGLTIVGINEGAGGTTLEVSEAARGDITLSRSVVSTSGAQPGGIEIHAGSLLATESVAFALNEGGEPGRDVNVTLGGALSIDRAVIGTGAAAGGRAGNVNVIADAVTLRGTGQDAGLGSSVSAGAGGDAGNVNVTARSIRLSDGGLLSATTDGDGNAGTIRIIAHDLRVSSAARIEADTSSAGAGGDILIGANSMRVTSSGQISSNTALARGGSIFIVASAELVLDGGLVTAVTASPLREGVGGSVRIRTDDLTLRNSGVIATTTIGRGRGGGVSIEARNVSLIGAPGAKTPTAISTGTAGRGDSGGIRVEADFVSVTNDALVNTSTAERGDGGNVRVLAREVLVDSNGKGNAGFFAATIGPGNGGVVRLLNAESVTLRGGGAISATGAIGSAGGVRVRAERLIIDGENESVQTGIIVGAAGFSAFGGGVLVDAELVRIVGGGEIDVSTSSPGQAGLLLIRGRDLQISGRGSSIASSTSGAGDAGGVVIQMRDLTISDGARIAARSTSTAPDAGIAQTVAIVAGRAITIDNAEVAVSAANANAGTVALVSNGVIDLIGGRVTAETPSAGGNIALSARHRLRLENSLITAQSGEGGTIVIDRRTRLDPGFVILNRSTINGLSAGAPVLVQINPKALLIQSVDSRILTNQPSLPPPIDIAGALVQLRGEVLAGAAQLEDVCVVRLGREEVSSFTIIGKRGITPSPGGWSIATEPVE